MSQFLFTICHQFRRRWFYGFISLLVAVGLIAGTPNSSQALPWLDLIMRGVQIVQISNMSDSQEVALGQQINRQLTTREFRLYGDRTINQYVSDLGQRLAPHSDRPNIPYVFQVVDDSQINAFATMGGYVYVTTELIKTADNEAQLASVLGHEIGHIAARHSLQQMRQMAIAQGVASATGLDRSTAINLGVELALRRPNSRRDEMEADTKGLANLTRAGYAPSAMVAFMQKLTRQTSLPSILSTHPAPRERVRALEQQIDPATANNGIGLDATAYQNQIRALL